MSLQPAFRRLFLALVLALTLYVGWKPFSFWVGNDVAFEESLDALRFNSGVEKGQRACRGMASSDKLLDTRDWEGFSLLVELRGRSDGSSLGVFLEFYEAGADAASAARLALWKQHLSIKSRRLPEQDLRGYEEIGSKNVFESGDFVTLLIVSGSRDTRVYVDGRRVVSRQGFSLLGTDNRFEGLLVLGNSYDGESPFLGEIRRAELYRGALEPGALEKSEASWSFDAREARFSDAGELLVPGLEILARYQSVERNFLKPISIKWTSKGTQIDMIVNLLGFLPVGVCIAAAARRRTRGRIARVLIVGLAAFSLSLAIEWGQAYLVHRDSSQLDLLLNSLSGLSALLVPRRWILFL